jgi:radical SAM superfamily enzyme with C-terminal helix-hairpin-helix motif
MAILYSLDGQSVQVFGSYIGDYLRQGYSTIPPNQVVQSAIAPELASLTELSGGIDINTASLKELQSLPLIGVAIAKKIAGARPYKDVSDLINKVPDVAWLDLRDRIAISNTESSSEETTEETTEETKE